ncbi:MAG TPA: DinB family protein [Ilumatobacter sp.]|nr:DinB family protein [Ilumatobacter sp.]
MSESVDLPPEVRDGDERATLVAMLDYYRAVLARKVAGLSPEQLQRTTAASTLTLGGLVKHMAMVEHTWFPVRFAGHPPAPLWADAPWDDDPDWEFHSAAGATADELLALYHHEIAEARAVLDAAPDLNARTPEPGHHGPYNLRWIVVHMIEEYARHCGHADLIREAIDGTVGD